mgnify:CR=1 FL=1
MFSDEQLALIAEAVEDYAILIDEDRALDCDAILHMIEAHFINKVINKDNVH